MNAPLPLARRDLIASRLANGQPVNSAALAAEYGVSEDAIRRDLRALAAEGRCRRVYGGALPISHDETPMLSRVGRDAHRKSALAQAAAQTIRASEFVFLDAGSTNLAIVDFIPPQLDLVIATNCIEIAAAAMQRGDIRLFMVGGTIDCSIGGAVDASALQAVEQMYIDRSFIGACSVSASSGFSVWNSDDAYFKKCLVRNSRQRVMLALNEKLTASATFRVASLSEFDLIFVEHNVDSLTANELTNSGATLLRAPPALDNA
ncbi:DeoR/GlpR transcriptional regulator [Paraburkholderia sp. Ac-20340]|uniref:DeoR/GlpR family DNA-binding transcription regulator n=1 Tax=Paraburkholderia sp. Ac-20340 TaxID=2703888 RepID=UPI00197D956C|nr:DeoR/GlpR family DNA-binding transcription regulator [Paraburkholderia sp. Ac-20340]MBN3854011.1 DeoR/GlpR transcriptional regulator [Paraburkholderia sp. Ac-20340]